MFHVSRKHLWWVLWSWNEPRRITLARLDWYLWVNGNSVRLVRQLFLRKGTAGGAMPNQRINHGNICLIYRRSFLSDRSPYTGVARPKPPDTVRIWPVV